MIKKSSGGADATRSEARALTHVTPGSDDVGHDIDGDGASGGGGHVRRPARRGVSSWRERAPTQPSSKAPVPPVVFLGGSKALLSHPKRVISDDCRRESVSSAVSVVRSSPPCSRARAKTMGAARMFLPSCCRAQRAKLSSPGSPSPHLCIKDS